MGKSLNLVHHLKQNETKTKLPSTGHLLFARHFRCVHKTATTKTVAAFIVTWVALRSGPVLSPGLSLRGSVPASQGRISPCLTELSQYQSHFTDEKTEAQGEDIICWKPGGLEEWSHNPNSRGSLQIHMFKQDPTCSGLFNPHNSLQRNVCWPHTGSCLENPGDGGAWWAAASGVAQSQTRLKRLSS